MRCDQGLTQLLGQYVKWIVINLVGCYQFLNFEEGEKTRALEENPHYEKTFYRRRKIRPRAGIKHKPSELEASALISQIFLCTSTHSHKYLSDFLHSDGDDPHTETDEQAGDSLPQVGQQAVAEQPKENQLQHLKMTQRLHTQQHGPSKGEITR